MTKKRHGTEAIKFLGCSVAGFNSNIGWGEQGSTCTINLVEDRLYGDSFVFNNSPDPGIGLPYTFTFGSFRFRGLLQSWRQTNARGGNPTFEVTLTDAKEILAGTQLVTSSYYSATSAVPNIINVFGFWENLTGFGTSHTNEGGMPWRTIYIALNSIVNNGFGPGLGGPLRFRDLQNRYTLDLTEIQFAPFWYRIRGNPQVSLLDAISQRCTDAGVDYFLEMSDDNVIKVRTVNRKVQIAYNNGPNSGSINRFVESNKQVESKNRGWELRNDGPTSKFLVGANISELYLATQASILPYWGADLNGNPLVSANLEDETGVTLNSLSCVDFIGPFYNCTVAEIRMAVAGEQYWNNYIANQKPQLANILGIANQYDISALQTVVQADIGPKPGQPVHKMDDAMSDFLHGARTGTNKGLTKASRLHRLVSSAGNQYMGKSFLVALPFVMTYIETETANIKNSHDIDTEGGYVSFGSTPLGLSPLNQLLFEQSSFRLGSFAYFNDKRIDAMSAVSRSSVLQSNGAYVQASIDGGIKYSPFPHVIVNLSQTITAVYKYPYNIEESIPAIFGNGFNTAPTLKFLSTNMVPTNGIGIPAKCLMPAAIAVPIRNNLITYGGGPAGVGFWFLNGAIGRSEFEQDTNLAPWNFGGYAGMHLAAVSKLFSSATNLLVSEAGDVRVAGLPAFSLGDNLVAAGSNITGIDVSIGQQGAVTSYKLKTFDYRFLGSLSKKQEERLARIGRGIQTVRARAREAFHKFYDNVITIYQAYRDGMHSAINTKSPHAILFATHYNITDKGYSEVAAMTPGDALASINPRDNSHFQQTAMMSINGLLRPYSTKKDDEYMPAFIEPILQLKNDDRKMTCQTLNPFRQDNDIIVYSRGTTFNKDMKSFDYNYKTKTITYSRQSKTGDNVRAIGLKGPLIVSGYGFNIYCRSAQDTVKNNGDWEVARDYLNEEDRRDIMKYRTGPVDLLWDDMRGVWTPHGTVYGYLLEDLDACDSDPRVYKKDKWPKAKIRLLGLDDKKLSNSIGLDGTMEVYNWSSAVISEKTKVLCGYLPQANKFVVIAANC
jgi:hypothetical protein